MTRPDRLTLAALVLVAAHFAVVAHFHQPAVSGPDASGYFAQAKLLATRGHSVHVPASPFEFVGPHWVDSGSGEYYSKYPPGIPLLLAVPYALIGPTAALWVDPLLASLTLLGLLFLCRLWLGPGWALAATALMAANPLVNQHAVPGFSHTAVAFLLVWGVYALARWSREGASAWLALAGFCVGLIPSARYAEALYAGAFALFVALRLRATGRSQRAALPGVVAAAVPMGLLALPNQLSFGAFWRTGYAVSGEQTGFGLGHFAGHWSSILAGLGGTGVGLLFALGVVGMALLAAHRDTRARGILLLALVVPTTLLYMAYYWGGDDMSQRFLLPTYYLYAVAGVWLLKLLSDQMGRAALAATAAVLVLSLPGGLSRSVTQLAQRSTRDGVLVAITDSLAQYVPAGAVLLTDRTLGQHLDVVSPWRVGHAEILLRDAGDGPGPGRGDAMRRPPGAADDDDRPHPMAGQSRQRQGKYRNLSAEERAMAIADDLRTWVGPDGTAYLMAPDEQTLSPLAALGLEWQVCARIDLPEAPAATGPGGRPGRMGPRGAGRRQPFPRAGAMAPGMPPAGPGFAAPGAAGPMGRMGARMPGGATRGYAGGEVLLVELML